MLNSSNAIANALKVIGIIIGTIGLIVTIFIGSDWSMFGSSTTALIMAVAVFMSCAISALLLYAFGEVISLLQDIKHNTSSNGAKQELASDDLPSL